ncbi:sugar phosphate nucleotidyltransferase [Bdellovibrio sp. SKB1291214]|uniref:sugar phosphate nucleotidyltransferase n=1 Tax=Bdellovibrio sp. SKB1291214 TaxID=1732569 RepID=UPI000B51B65A|nr:sugar phosphate nucleotidyltransferase [Bdellovibrio sp. SKB1291214]UYL08302.1 sugar phosphate nucleotidyltransferase [Bdellovibrio sp. SKB1291214]
MKVLILMAGPQRLKEMEEPAALVSHHGKTIIELLSKKISELEGVSEVIGVIKNSDSQNFHLDNVFKLAFPAVKVISISGQTQGAACSALMAYDYIDSNEELLILSGDEFVDISFNDMVKHFRANNAAGGVASFDSLHPSFSYAIIDSKNEVEMVTEKNPVSRNALVGLWYFKSGSEFINCLKNTIRKDAFVKGQFFISPAFNELILAGGKVLAYKISQESYFPLKNDLQVQTYLKET